MQVEKESPQGRPAPDMRRTDRTLGRLDLLHAFGGGSVAATLMFLPLVLGLTVIPYDYEFYHFPLWRLIFDSIRLSTFPHYDPFIYSGSPFLSNAQSMLYYPPVLLFLYIKSLFSSEFKIYDGHFINLFHYTIAYAGTFVWVRRRGAASPLLAHALSLAAVFSGSWIANAQHAGQITAFGWFPWLLVASERLIEQPRALRIIPIGVLLALVQLAGFLPIAVTINLVLAFYCLALVAGRYLGAPGGPTLRELATILAAFFAAHMLHVLLTALLWGGAFAVLPEGPAIMASRPRAWPILLSYFAPNVFNHFDLPAFKGVTDPTASYFFAGIIPFLAFCLLVRPGYALRNAAFVTGGICLLFALDPLDVWKVVHHVPVVGVLYRPIHMYCFVGYFLILALADAPARILRMGAWLAALLLLAGAAGLAIPTLMVRNIQIGWPHLLQSSVIGALLILIFAAVRTRHSANLLLLALAISTFAFHALVPNRLWSSTSRPETYGPNTVSYGMEDMIALLRQGDEPHRVAVDQKTVGAEFNAGWRVWRIEPINGFEPILDKAYRDYLRDGVARWSTGRTFGDIDPDSAKLNELNVKYLLVHMNTPINHPRWELMFDRHYRVYRNRNFTSRFRFSERCDAGDEVKILDSRAGQHSVGVATSCDNAVLLASERPHKGWQITIDGRPVAWTAVNPAIGIAIAIPRGAHFVTLKYRTPGFAWAVGLEVLGLLMIGGLVLSDGQARRRICRAVQRKSSASGAPIGLTPSG